MTTVVYLYSAFLLIHITTILFSVNTLTTSIGHVMFHDANISNSTHFKTRLNNLQNAGRQVLSRNNFINLGEFGGKYVYNQEFTLFKEFVNLFQRGYGNDTSQLNERFEIFQGSLQRHAALNKKETKRNGTAKYGINKYSDWEDNEFQNLVPTIAKFNKSVPVERLMSASFFPLSNHYYNCRLYRKPYPKSKDWRPFTTKVKDQKGCGSCWAFVTSEQVETYSAISGEKLIELSPQELVSCAPSLGCRGGNTCLASYWLSYSKRPLVQEESYPYKAKDSACQTDKLKEGRKINTVCGCHRMVGHEHIMIQVLAQKGPLGVNVDAVSWRDYTGGVIQHHCSSKNLNHAVQIVGYNFEGPVPYYIVRNQWGSSFGEDGYLRIKYGKNLCGIAEEPSFLLV